MYRYKITLEYLGANYCGWQKQRDSLSLQKIIEDAIFSFSKEHITLVVAGRTDAGVNAYAQVAHFDLKTYYQPKRLMHSINHFSRPHTIGIIDAEIVGHDFHARFSAKQRHYVYKILNRNSINIINNGFQLLVRHELDIKQMQNAANFLVGHHDFTSFRAKECQANSAMKTIDSIKIEKYDNNIEVQISALSFLHHMVRNIVGSLLLVGRGTWSPEKMKEVLDTKDRTLAGPTAPPEGLYLIKIDY